MEEGVTAQDEGKKEDDFSLVTTKEDEEGLQDASAATTAPETASTTVGIAPSGDINGPEMVGNPSQFFSLSEVALTPGPCGKTRPWCMYSSTDKKCACFATRGTKANAEEGSALAAGYKQKCSSTPLSLRNNAVDECRWDNIHADGTAESTRVLPPGSISGKFTDSGRASPGAAEAFDMGHRGGTTEARAMNSHARQNSGGSGPPRGAAGDYRRADHSGGVGGAMNHGDKSPRITEAQAMNSHAGSRQNSGGSGSPRGAAGIQSPGNNGGVAGAMKGSPARDMYLTSSQAQNLAVGDHRGGTRSPKKTSATRTPFRGTH